MICEYFRVTGVHDTVLDGADIFSLTLRNDDVQECDTRWDEFLLSMCEATQQFTTQLLHQSAPPRHHSDHANATRTELALWCTITLDGVPHRWVPAGHPRYTRAWYNSEAVGGSTSRAQKTDDHISPHNDQNSHT